MTASQPQPGAGPAATIGRWPLEFCLGAAHAQALTEGWRPLPFEVLDPGCPQPLVALDASCTAATIDDDIVCLKAGDWLFGQLVLEEPDDLPLPGGTALAERVEAAYQRIFRLAARAGAPFIARCWNFIPDITAGPGDDQRYFHFNSGRQRAFRSDANPQADSPPPAASAVGVAGHSLHLCFLASATAALPFENPRQMHAYAYPREYGPERPLFSRAAVGRLAGTTVVLVSGTASIIGHRSVHQDQPLAQLDETLRNITTLLAGMPVTPPCTPPAPAALALNVYLRHPEHLSMIHDAILRALPGVQAPRFVRADICRPDLLLEVEAFGRLAQ